MSDPILHEVTDHASIAYDASYELDCLKLEVHAISKTAQLLSGSESLTEEAQMAFYAIANSLDTIAKRIDAKSDEFMARKREAGKG